MKTLCFVTAFTPSELSAGQKYTLALLNDLSREYEIDLIYFHQEPLAPLNLPASVRCHPIRVGLVRKLLGFLQLPFLHPIFGSRFAWSWAWRISRTAREADLLYLDFSQTFAYSLVVHHPRTVLMAHDVLIQSFERKRSSGRFWIGVSERFLLRRSRALLLVPSDKDAVLVRDRYQRRAEAVSQYLDPRAALLDVGRTRFDNSFVFFGAWARPENWEGLIWFIQEVLPQVKRQVRWKVVGSGLSEPKRAYLSAFGMEVLGFLDDPFPEIAKAHALVAPLFLGAGVKVKVIESLASGTRVIGTPVALEGIGERFPDAVTMVQSASEFLEALEKETADATAKVQLQLRFTRDYSQKSTRELIKESFE